MLRKKFNRKILVWFQEGETVLISAARDGHLEVVRTLLSKYADVEAADTVSFLNDSFERRVGDVVTVFFEAQLRQWSRFE